MCCCMCQHLRYIYVNALELGCHVQLGGSVADGGMSGFGLQVGKKVRRGCEVEDAVDGRIGPDAVMAMCLVIASAIQVSQ